MKKEVIYVDLDNSLMKVPEDKSFDLFYMGKPTKLVERVKEEVKKGNKIVIFTARLSELLEIKTYYCSVNERYLTHYIETEEFKRLGRDIKLWCYKQNFVPFSVTCIKGRDATQIWDNIAIPVIEGELKNDCI